MNGKENIINKILSDADERCAEIVADAERRAAQTVGAAEEAVKRDREALDRRLQAVLQEKLRNARANAQLDGRKYRLEVRQRLVTECYDEVHRRLAAMNEEDRFYWRIAVQICRGRRDRIRYQGRLQGRNSRVVEGI